MKSNKVENLIIRLLKGKITAQKKQEMANKIEDMSDDDLYEVLDPVWENYIPDKILSDNKSEQIIQNILKQPEISLQKKQSNYRIFASMAASIVLILSVYFFWEYKSTANHQPYLVKAIVIQADKAVNYTRHLTLNDGSTVLLKAGSTLSYLSGFNAKTREIMLTGEAYFDIAHNAEKPFIIHTGDVKTTVLGTAFDIKAWPQQKYVTVSVTRGKVKVEDENKVLAVLVKNQSVNYDTNIEKIETETVNANETVQNWTSSDMDFNHVTLNEIAKTLSKRYGVDIEFKNPELAQISVVTSFKGTESINEIFDVLCKISPDCSYSINNKIVVLDSKIIN